MVTGRKKRVWMREEGWGGKMRGGICHRGSKEWKRGMGRRDKMETDTIRGISWPGVAVSSLVRPDGWRWKWGRYYWGFKVLYFMLITFDEWAIFIFLLAFSSWMNERWESFVRHSHLFRDIFLWLQVHFSSTVRDISPQKIPFLTVFTFEALLGDLWMNVVILTMLTMVNPIG